MIVTRSKFMKLLETEPTHRDRNAQDAQPAGAGGEPEHVTVSPLSRSVEPRVAARIAPGAGDHQPLRDSDPSPRCASRPTPGWAGRDARTSPASSLRSASARTRRCSSRAAPPTACRPPAPSRRCTPAAAAVDLHELSARGVTRHHSHPHDPAGPGVVLHRLTHPQRHLGRVDQKLPHRLRRRVDGDLAGHRELIQLFRSCRFASSHFASF